MSLYFLAFAPWHDSDSGVFRPSLDRWLAYFIFVTHIEFSSLSDFALNSQPLIVWMVVSYISCLKQGNKWCQGAGYGWVVESENPKNEDMDGCVHYPTTEQHVPKANIKVSVVEIGLPEPARSKRKTSASIMRTFKSWWSSQLEQEMNTNKFTVIDKVTTSKLHDNNLWVVPNVSNNW